MSSIWSTQRNTWLHGYLCATMRENEMKKNKKNSLFGTFSLYKCLDGDTIGTQMPSSMQFLLEKTNNNWLWLCTSVFRWEKRTQSAVFRGASVKIIQCYQQQERAHQRHFHRVLPFRSLTETLSKKTQKRFMIFYNKIFAYCIILQFGIQCIS